ncbi:MAG TPA: carboxypeptidase regulatory-like domain-containing protein [Kofleriaceae bacterium]|nr:carboxypeptidase regulatory-like domain-containing protein [Kofleriaceae bacterium]
MTELRACPSCHRHVAITERACPFCAASLAPVAPRAMPRQRLNRLAVFTSATLASSACWTSSTTVPQQTPPPPPNGSDEVHEVPTFSDPPPGPSDAGAAAVQPTGTAVIRGVLIGSRSRQPMPGVIVSVFEPPSARQNATTDATGTFTFTKLPAGDYRIVAGSEHPRRGFAAQAIVKLGNGETKQITMTYAEPDPNALPMPYGAPPARGRVV